MADDSITLLRRFMLALCVWREARGETPKGKILVAQVILNRVIDKRWPDNIVDVVTQPWQFSSFNANDPNVTKYPEETDTSWRGCADAADAVLTAKEPWTTANHYHVVGLDPKWRDETKIVATEGHHVFYCL